MGTALKTKLLLSFLGVFILSFTVPVMLVSLASPEVALLGVGIMANLVLAGMTLYSTRIVRSVRSSLTMRKRMVQVALFMYALSIIFFSLPLLYGDSGTLGYLRLLFAGAGTVIATLSLSKKPETNRAGIFPEEK